MTTYNTTIGPLLVGIFFNTFLYGLVIYQFAAYYRTKFDDRPTTKCMVVFLFILDTFHSAAVIYMAWYYTVTNYNNPAALAGKLVRHLLGMTLIALEDGVWPYPFTAIGTALAALVTQIFLGFRIWCLTDSKILYGVVIILAIPSFTLGIVCGIEAWIIHIHSELPRITSLVIAWLSMQVIVDTFVTTTLVIVFYRSRTGFRKTDTILNRLIRGAIQTGLFAGIFSVGDLLSFAVFPSTNFYGLFAIPLGRIYTNTLLDTLLTRELLKAEMDGTDRVSGALGSLGWAVAASPQTTSTSRAVSIQFKVPRTVHETCDPSTCDDAEDKAVPIEA